VSPTVVDVCDGFPCIVSAWEALVWMSRDEKDSKTAIVLIFFVPLVYAC
jgi:hypothetical protein